MPRQPAPRLHRLPQRLDYTLIPAPLDLSLPLMTEKSPLPAIIVTPSSPSSAHDYSIAFLAPPKVPGFFERLGARMHWTKSAAVTAESSNPNTPLRLGLGLGFGAQTARTLLILFLVLFVMLTHLITHRMAQTSRRPFLDFSIQDPNPAPVTTSYISGEIGGDNVHGLHGLHGSLSGLDRLLGFEEGNDHDGIDSVPSSAMESGRGHGHGLGGIGKAHHGHGHAHGDWFDLSRYWGNAQEEDDDDEKRDFIVFA
ncbi:hypothetical protein J3R30DRAFT_3523071 [Lentinula aciculospora]|uniref:Uncharacterized protein n=1 Tax=Lentinula aciculospora TaxID=153920 RepID=A0A9W9A160_9AGAR|nr:hypothetical protein J3R30DRAFT_3523071 [Lentinula aciculospora]